MTYAEACAFLIQLERRGVRLGLDRIIGALHDHGDPQETFGSILVGGTNGKGSVTAMIASCFAAGGLRAGLYTSPHLLDFRERMRVDGRMISPGEVVDLVERARAAIDRWQLSFFEATTLIALLWFRDRCVEMAGIEVGLGGRLDATRPVNALVTVVTNIGLDHVKILGPTHEAIAAEKAGIFRSGAPVATAATHPKARAVLRARAAQLGAPFHERRDCLRVSSIRESASGTRFRIDPRLPLPGLREGGECELRLAGRHQVGNAALAALALGLLPSRATLPVQAIREGLARVRWPGRFDLLSEDPPIVCDVAHNTEGARVLARTLRRSGRGPVRLVIGMIEGKDHRGVLLALRDCVQAIHFCTPRVERALPATALAEIGAEIGLAGPVHDSPGDAIDQALHARARGETILVAGSFFTVGQAMERLGAAPLDPLWEPVADGRVSHAGPGGGSDRGA